MVGNNNLIHLAVNVGETDAEPIRDWKHKYKEGFKRDLLVSEMSCDGLLERILKENSTAPTVDNEPYLDAIAYAPMWLQPLVFDNKLVDLTSLLQEKSITLIETIEGLEKDFFRNYLDYAAWVDMEEKRPGNTIHSRLMALPGTHTGATLLFYRKDLLERIGAEMPTTWSEFNRLARELHQIDPNVYGTVICGKHKGQPPVTDWYARFASLGGKQLLGSMLNKNLTSNACSEEGIKAYEYIAQLWEVMPNDVMEYTTADCVKAMAKGKVAMAIGITSFAFPQGYYSKEMKDVIGVAPIPGASKTYGVGYGGGWSLAIPKSAIDVEMSWKTIQLFSSKEFDKYRCMQYGTTPVRHSTTEDAEVIDKQPWVKVAGQVMDRAVAPEYFYLPEAANIMQAVDNVLTKGLSQRQKAVEVMRAMDKQVNWILKESGWQR